MVIWINILKDEGNKLSGYSEIEQEHMIKIETDDYDFDIKGLFAYCRYDEETERVIYDEEIALNLRKEDLIYDFKKKSVQELIKGFKVNINDKIMTFRCTPENKSFLEQAYSLFTNKIITETNLPFVDENGNEILERIVGSNIFEVWLLYYVHEEDINRKLTNEIMPKIDNAKTLQELEEIKW